MDRHECYLFTNLNGDQSYFYGMRKLSYVWFWLQMDYSYAFS